jgi:DNA-binding PadR family transcriptional regulator
VARRSRIPSPQQILVLEAILAREPRYGYDLMKATGLGPGTMYGLLRRLHDDGHLVRDTEMVEGRARARYRLTDRGRRYAERALIEEEYERALRDETQASHATEPTP